MMKKKTINLIVFIAFVVTFISVMAKAYVLAGCAFIFGSLFLCFYKGGDK